MGKSPHNEGDGLNGDSFGVNRTLPRAWTILMLSLTACEAGHLIGGDPVEPRLPKDAGLPRLANGHDASGERTPFNSNANNGSSNGDDSIACLPLPRESRRSVVSHPRNRWVRRATPEQTPPFGWEAGAAYDPSSSTWLHHGGHDGIPQGFALFAFSFEQNQWRQRFAPTSPGGACNLDGSMAVDTRRRLLIRFPSDSLGHGYQYSRSFFLKYSWVWLYDIAAGEWKNMRPPPYTLSRDYTAEDWVGGNSSVAYDPVRGIFYKFGGGTSQRLFHVYDPHDNSITEITTTPAPSHRNGAGLAFNAASDALILFGSQWGKPDSRTWSYDPKRQRWTAHQLQPTPPFGVGNPNHGVASIPRIACDDIGHSCLAVTWQDSPDGGRGGRHETWRLDTRQWKWQRVGTNDDELPSSLSRSRNLHFAADLRLYVLELQASEAGPKKNSLWTFRPDSDRQSDSPESPRSLQLVVERERTVMTWPRVPGAVGYRIYRGEGSRRAEVATSLLAGTRCPAYTDHAVASGKIYHYDVRSIDDLGNESVTGAIASTKPSVPEMPRVSLPSVRQATLRWSLPRSSTNIVGYNVYRGLVTPRAKKKGSAGTWTDNDPEYAQTAVVQVEAIEGLEKINDTLLFENRFVDRGVDLTKTEVDPADYRYKVFAYVVRSVNRRGDESGPSPYALTIPQAPRNVFVREVGQRTAEIKWDGVDDGGIAGYQVVRLGSGGAQTGYVIDTQLTTSRRITRRLETQRNRFWITAVDHLGQLGEPSSPAWFGHRYSGYFEGPWHQ